MSAYIFGYGVICPILIGAPFYFMSIFLFENLGHIFSLCGAFPNIYLLRVLEAIHGATPAYGKADMWTYTQYYSATLLFQFDSKTNKAIPYTSDIRMKKNMEYLSVYIQTSLLYSILIPNGYKIAPTHPIETFFYLYHWKNLLNGFFMAALTSAATEGKRRRVFRGLICSFILRVCSLFSSLFL